MASPRAIVKLTKHHRFGMPRADNTGRSMRAGGARRLRRDLYNCGGNRGRRRAVRRLDGGWNKARMRSASVVSFAPSRSTNEELGRRG